MKVCKGDDYEEVLCGEFGSFEHLLLLFGFFSTDLVVHGSYYPKCIHTPVFFFCDLCLFVNMQLYLLRLCPARFRAKLHLRLYSGTAKTVNKSNSTML